MNKRRNFDKWILPKNNKSFDRHRSYVAFVINFKKMNGKYPTVDEYLNNIVSFLRFTGLNKTAKKTAENHQLFQPIFFNMLEEQGGLIIPTVFGILFMLDSTGFYNSEIIYSLFKSANFSTSATGSAIKYNGVYPVKLLFDNLIKHATISFKELNEKFHTTKNKLDIKLEDSDSSKSPKWAYILSMLEEAGLITVHGNVLNISIENKNYLPTSWIKPTYKLLKLVTTNKIKEMIISQFSIENLEENIDNIIANTKNNNTHLRTSGRNTVDQAAYRTLLISRYHSCNICGIKNKKILVASHIKPYSKCKESEAFDIANGLLLCSGHDALFDKGLITFENGKFKFSDELSGHDLNIIIKSASFEKTFDFDMKTMAYLHYHKENIFK